MLMSLTEMHKQNIPLSNYNCYDKLFKNEAEFTSWFGWCIKSAGWFFHKISDQDQRVKPFDAIFVLDWVAWSIEFKYVKTKKRKPYMLLRWSSPSNPWWQVMWLDLYQKNWWLSLVIIYNSIIRKYVVYNFSLLYPEYVDHV